MSNKQILVLSCMLAVIVLVFHLSSKKKPGAEETEGMSDLFRRPVQWQGKYAPDFEMELLGGEAFRLSDNIGKKAIILNFFATWCGSCKQEMPELTAYYNKHREEPFLLIGIDSNEKQEKVEEFVNEYNVNFPVGIDKGDRIQKLFTVKAFPTTVAIGADGTILIYEVGPIMNADIAFDSFLNEAFEAIQAGAGITREAYLEGLEGQKDFPPAADGKGKDELTGRAKTIVERMDCPCGCSDKVMDCGCKTAKDIRKQLRKYDFAGKTDAEVIRELNREFCVKDDKG